MTPLRVLIGCEESQVFQQEFEEAGFDAWSCDLQPTRGPRPNRHIRGDVRDVMQWGWDLLVLHPPCTRLCRAGGHWLYGKGRSHPKRLPKGRTWADLQAEYAEAVALFSDCLAAPVPFRAIENPEMHTWAKQDIPGLPKPHIVQPWWFGHPVFKATGWYLAGLPGLEPTDRLDPPARGTEEYRQWSSIHRMAPGPNRARDRAMSFPGMARAAANQWGAVVRQAVAHAA